MKRFFLFQFEIFLFLSLFCIFSLSLAETLGKSKTFQREIFTDFLRFPLIGAVSGASFVEGYI